MDMLWQKLSDPEMIAAIFAGLSVAGALVAIVSANRASRDAILAEWTRDIVDWGSACIDAISELHMLARADPKKTSDPSFFNRRQALLHRLSALIDRGRVFFENDRSTGHGTDKPYAYQGLVPALIQHLNEIHYLARQLDYRNAKKNRLLRDPIITLKREFVSEWVLAIRSNSPNSLRKATGYVKERQRNSGKDNSR